MKKQRQKLIVAKFSEQCFCSDQLVFFEEAQASRSNDVKIVSLKGLLDDGWEIKSVGDWHSATTGVAGSASGQATSFIQTIVLEKEVYVD